MYFVWLPYEPDPDHRPALPRVLDPTADPETLRATLRELSYDELVSAWRSSDRRLQDAGCLAHRVAVVALRGLVLDELERRSPRRYRRWLRRCGPTRATRGSSR
jgi:hypothetical protein